MAATACKWKSWWGVLAALAMALTSLTQALSTHAFNVDRIHAQYQNGDFEQLIKELTVFEKSGRPCSYNDSIFLEKHLAVVYASNPATRELGRYHMHRLLELAPAAELLDMFVGEEVDQIFEKVRKEHVFAKNNEPPKKIIAAPAKAPIAFRKPSRNITRVQAQASVQTPPPAPAAAPAPAPAPAKTKPLAVASAESIPVATMATPIQNEDLPSPPQHGSPLSTPQPLVHEPDSLPIWKEKGLWIGGSAAMALLAFTLYYSGSPNTTPSKTYVVPATATK